MAKLKMLTWKDVTNFSYDLEEKYGPFRGTILDILYNKEISNKDKIMISIRKDILDEDTLRLFACACVREVWDLLINKHSKNAVIMAEKYANGEITKEELIEEGANAHYAVYNDYPSQAIKDAIKAASYCTATLREYCDYHFYRCADDIASINSNKDEAYKKQVEILISLIKERYETN